MRVGLFVSVALLGALASPAEMRADVASTGGRRLDVVARIGSVTISVGDVEDRIASLPPFQRATFGGTRNVVRRRFLDEVLVVDALLSTAAEAQKLGEQQPAAYLIERARSAATIRAVRGRLGPATAIPLDAVQRSYDENLSRYETPERYQIWRILCKTAEDAQQVLDAAKREPTPLHFGALAREHSLDKATYLRAGNLGFVTSDGSTNEPGLRVEPAIVRAAKSVPDGALVPAPVAEGEYFSVVWRRGTIAATHRAVGEVEAQIRDTIWKSRVKEETDKLVANLRASRLRDLDPAVLLVVDIPPDEGDTGYRTVGQPSTIRTAGTAPP
jgi:peptidyl-prolyl cis-trans isomerase C